KQLARNVIRKVPNHFHVAFREKNSRVEIKRVAMANLESRLAKFFAQKISQPRILLQRQQTRAALQDLAGKGAEPRSNFENKIVRANLRLLDYPTCQVLIVQEVLPQSFRWSQAGVVERCANLRKVHWRISQKGCQTRPLFTKSCEQSAKRTADL